MFSLDEVIHFHDVAIEQYGGSKGVRDFGSLDAALNRPWQTFDGEYLYPTSFTKAAAILESIILNLPFIDGNKRTAFFLCETLLENNGFTINADTESIYNFLIAVAVGASEFETLVKWLQQNSHYTEQPT
ncbi:type II toxin-antitoxin system death-on-curing family toxin [soil metagenome]